MKSTQAEKKNIFHSTHQKIIFILLSPTLVDGMDCGFLYGLLQILPL